MMFDTFKEFRGKALGEAIELVTRFAAVYAPDSLDDLIEDMDSMLVVPVGGKGYTLISPDWEELTTGKEREAITQGIPESLADEMWDMLDDWYIWQLKGTAFELGDGENLFLCECMEDGAFLTTRENILYQAVAGIDCDSDIDQMTKEFCEFWARSQNIYY